MATTHTFPFTPLVSPEEQGGFTEAMAEALTPVLDGYSRRKDSGNGKKKPLLNLEELLE